MRRPKNFGTGDVFRKCVFQNCDPLFAEVDRGRNRKKKLGDRPRFLLDMFCGRSRKPRIVQILGGGTTSGCAGGCASVQTGGLYPGLGKPGKCSCVR